QPYFVEVPTTKHIDVKLAAKLADMPVEEFQSLNPGNSRPVIKADGERMLLVPADKAASFKSAMQNHDEPLVSWQAYKLKPGETIDRVAARHNMSVAQLKHVNGIAAKRGVGAGTTLLIPASLGASATPYLPDLPAPTVTMVKAPKKSGKQALRKSGPSRTALKAGKHASPGKSTAPAKSGNRTGIKKKSR
ncbi:MAG TPA: LysM peptidoglycan-binding domain-containing protein, partial [Burkholderiales bacterium]|nr:LysM peptidoglycan-binding domain-containing protein [Burkholderiales bacterium]